MASGLLNDEQDASHTSLSLAKEPLCHVITPIGMLGYGFDALLTHGALKELASKHSNTPAAIIVDSGSTDSGPGKLALGGMTCPRSAYERDMAHLMALSHEFAVPILISSAGGDGTDAHVDEMLDIIQEVADEPENSSYDFRTLAVYSNINKSTVSESLAAGGISGCGLSVPSLTAENIENAVTIVAQMGPEPFLDAMNTHPDFDIVIGGRAYDPSPHVAFCMFHAYRISKITSLSDAQIGGFTHMGKIMECGGLCAIPKSLTSMATIYLDGSFDIKPLDAGARCTPLSVASHTLYEKSRPDLLAGPGGALDLTTAHYQQLPDETSVHVYGGTFKWLRDSGEPYTVKLEAAKVQGFRTMFMGGIRDRILISQIDTVLTRVKEHVRAKNKNIQGDWNVGFHVYGANGIMGSLEPGDKEYNPREIFVVGEALAPTQKAASAIASSARVAMVHGSYPGQRGTGGNLAMGLGGKMEIELGPCAEFCMYHLMVLPNGTEGARQIIEGISKEQANQQDPLFSWRVKQIRNSASSACRETNSQVRQLKGTIQTNGNGHFSKAPLGTTKPKLAKLSLTSSSTLAEIAPVIRSKNSGPYDITLDVVFSSLTVYNTIKKSNLLGRATIARLYHLQDSQIIWCGFFDQAMAFKATIPRMRDGEFVSSGAFMETDVHASQQYAGLLDLKLGDEICVELMALGVPALA